MARLAFPTDDEMLSGTMLAAPSTDVSLPDEPDELPTDPLLFAAARESDGGVDEIGRHALR